MQSFYKKMIVCFAALTLMGTSVASTEANRPSNPRAAAVKSPHPQPKFAGRSSGEEAIRRLRSSRTMAAFAKHYRMTEQKIEQIFRTDPSAFLDPNGRLLYVEQIGAVTEPVNTNTNQTNIPLDQTFLLESKPGAVRTIYLDFNGHTTTGTAWNSSYGVNTIISSPFDLDGIPNTFSTAELQAIQNIWKRVAEDYAPFDVNVTTRLISEDQLTRSSSSDVQFGIRVVVTKDWTVSTASGTCGCGGFAYVGVFDFVGDTYKPAFVFYDKLASNEKYIAEAVSHEAGHTVGLSHDGSSAGAYYTGHGTGVTGWAPIMGVGYYKNLVQWSKGEYAGANNKEDDYLVMQQNSLYFDADEAGNTIATAKSLSHTVVNGLARFSVQATLQGPTDTDVFEINVGLGSLTINANPQITSPNTDIALSLWDINGNLLAQSNPVDLLSASITFNIPSAGKYYVAVAGAGKGDPLSTGYTNYGSVGTYTVVADGPIPSTTNTPPNAVITTANNTVSGKTPLTINFSGSQSTDDAGISSYQWDFGDNTTGTGVNISKTYSVVGNYTVVLTVTDTAGATGRNTLTISAQQPDAIPLISVGNISMIAIRKGRQYYAQARVLVVDQNGKAIPNATVSGTWSNRVTGSSKNITSSTGVAIIESPRTNSPGTFTFTVTNITANGFQYDSSINKMTSNSVNVF